MAEKKVYDSHPGRKKVYGDIREKAIMKRFPVTKKEKTGCTIEKLTNNANRASLRKYLVNISDSEVGEAARNFETKYN